MDNQTLIDFYAPLVVNEIMTKLANSDNNLEEVIRELKKFQSEFNNYTLRKNEFSNISSEYSIYNEDGKFIGRGLCSTLSWWRNFHKDGEVVDIIIDSMKVVSDKDYLFPLDESSLITRREFIQELINYLIGE